MVRAHERILKSPGFSNALTWKLMILPIRLINPILGREEQLPAQPHPAKPSQVASCHCEGLTGRNHVSPPCARRPSEAQSCKALPLAQLGLGARAPKNNVKCEISLAYLRDTCQIGNELGIVRKGQVVSGLLQQSKVPQETTPSPAQGALKWPSKCWSANLRAARSGHHLSFQQLLEGQSSLLKI